MSAEAAEHLAAAQAQMDDLCRILTLASRDDIERYEVCLTAAVEEFKRARELWGQTPPGRAELAKTKRIMAKAGMARRLLENAFDYQAGWQRILAVMSGGYTAEGGPVPLNHARQISVTG